MLTDARKGVKRGSPGRRSRPSYVACGLHPVAAFLEARPADVEGVLATRESRAGIEHLAATAGLRVEASDPRTLDGLSGGAAHQGIVALGRPPRAWDLEDLLAESPRILVVLDGLTDPRNVGAVLRSAEAVGAGGLIVARDRAPGLTPALVKAAAGAVEWLPIARVTNLARALASIRSAGFWTIGLDGGAGVSLGEPGVLPGLPAALVVGAEGKGIRPLVQKGCDRLVRIPMAGRTESLNVSVAAGVGLWELARLGNTASS